MIFNYIEEKPIPTDDKGGFEVIKLHKGFNIDHMIDYVLVSKLSDGKILKNLFIRMNQSNTVEVPKEFITGKGRKEIKYVKEVMPIEHKIFDTETVDAFLTALGIDPTASNVFEEVKELETTI